MFFPAPSINIEHMDEDITKIFHLQVLLFAFSVILILLASTILIHGKYQKSRITSDFHHELVLTANDFYHMVITSEENLKALSSRTMIKNALASLAEGERTLGEARDYTQPKFADGVKVYSEIIYARRLDSKGNLIAEYPPGNPAGFIFSSRDISFFRNERGCHITLNFPIFQKDRLIGRDQAVFFLCDFQESQFILLQNLSVIDTPRERTSFSHLAEAVPLADTGYYLYGELNRNTVRDESRKTLRISLLEAFLLILILALLSYFTIMRLMVRLVKERNRINRESLKSEKETAISQVIAGLAHEINNVLTGIFGLSDNLEIMPGFPEEGKPLLESIKESSDRMALFMRKLTDYSRHNIYGTGRIDPVAALEKLTKGWKKTSGSSVKINLVPSGEDLTISMVPDHFAKVITNLLDNASESMGGVGEIDLELENTPPLQEEECHRCGIPLNRRWIRFRMRDRGKGIPSHVLPRIFDPFFSTDKMKDGLGLAQASGIVLRYGGHLYVEETSPEGTVMTILFPEEDRE